MNTCVHFEHFRVVATGGSRIRCGWEASTGPGSFSDTVPSNEVRTETSLSWEASGSEVAGDDDNSGWGGFEYTISDAEDGETSAVEGVGSSATGGHSKLGSGDEALSWKFKPASIARSLRKCNPLPASASPTLGL